MIAVARRVRSNYLWILLIRTLDYAGKPIVHPVPLPGELMLIAGAVYILAGIGLVLWMNGIDRRRSKDRAVRGSSMG